MYLDIFPFSLGLLLIAEGFVLGGNSERSLRVC